MARIFISHSSDDSAIVRRLVNLLVVSTSGLDRSDVHCMARPSGGIRAGAWITQELLSEIRAADCFIAVVSESYLESSYCIWELGVRLGAERSRVLPVYLPGVEPEGLGGILRNMLARPLFVKDEVHSLLQEVAGVSEAWRSSPDASDEEEFSKHAAAHVSPGVEEWARRLVRLTGAGVFLNAYGLVREPVRRPLFQNFHPGGANTQPLQYSWADPRHGNSISTLLMRGATPDASFLRVSFDHKPNSFGCNMAIRPQDREAVDAKGATSVVVSARVPEESEIAEVGLGLRLVNGFMQHWERVGAEPVECIRGREFQDISVRFDPACWDLFENDGTGRAGPEAPVFSILESIVLSLGGYDRMATRPTAARGVVDFREISVARADS